MYLFNLIGKMEKVTRTLVKFIGLFFQGSKKSNELMFQSIGYLFF